jgi:hypothetical protein
MLKNWIKSILKDAVSEYFDDSDDRSKGIKRRWRYRRGVHDKPLRVKPRSPDDNIIVNFTGLLVDRSVSLLFGGEKDVRFDLPGDGETPEQTYIDEVWQKNNKAEMLYDLADYGAVSGVCAVKILSNDGYPDMQVIDPETLEIIVNQENTKEVVGYSITYTIIEYDERGNERKLRRQQVIVPDEDTEGKTWLIHDYKQNRQGKMEEMENSPVVWEYEFAPLVHWKNLPLAGSQYGRPDLTEDVIEINDAINMTLSNAQKVMRLQSHQRIWGKMLGAMNISNWGVDKILTTQSPDAEIKALEAGGDLSGMREFALMLRDAMMSIARSPDPSTFKDKVGQITNFALRVLYKDALDKLETKRRLYGDGLRELNRRLLLLNGMNEDAGRVVWDKALPEDDIAQINALTSDVALGIASKETAAKKRGYDWEDERERISSEAQDADNIGGLILSRFDRGQ